MKILTEEQLNLVITIQDAREAGYCVNGCRRNFEKHKAQLGVSFKQVIRDGVTVREAIKLNDVFFNRLVNYIIKKQEAKL